MSCDGNRATYFMHLAQQPAVAAALGGSDRAAAVLEAIWDIARNQPLPPPGPARQMAQLRATADTAALALDMRTQVGLPLSKHSRDGLPKAATRPGFQAVWQTVEAIRHGRALPELATAYLAQQDIRPSTPTVEARTVRFGVDGDGPFAVLGDAPRGVDRYIADDVLVYIAGHEAALEAAIQTALTSAPVDVTIPCTCGAPDCESFVRVQDRTLIMAKRGSTLTRPITMDMAEGLREEVDAQRERDAQAAKDELLPDADADASLLADPHVAAFEDALTVADATFDRERAAGRWTSPYEGTRPPETISAATWANERDFAAWEGRMQARWQALYDVPEATRDTARAVVEEHVRAAGWDDEAAEILRQAVSNGYVTPTEVPIVLYEADVHTVSSLMGSQRRAFSMNQVVNLRIPETPAQRARIRGVYDAWGPVVQAGTATIIMDINTGRSITDAQEQAVLRAAGFADRTEVAAWNKHWNRQELAAAMEREGIAMMQSAAARAAYRAAAARTMLLPVSWLVKTDIAYETERMGYAVRTARRAGTLLPDIAAWRMAMERHCDQVVEDADEL